MHTLRHELTERIQSFNASPRTSQHWLLAWAFLLAVWVYAGLSNYLTSRSSDWYESLDAPSFQPPDLVFAIIWPLNFLALSVVGPAYILTRRTSLGRTFLGLFILSAAFSLGWAYLFYIEHLLFAAALCLLLAALINWTLIATAFAANRWMGWGLIVYAGWLSLATALAFAYAFGN